MTFSLFSLLLLFSTQPVILQRENTSGELSLYSGGLSRFDHPFYLFQANKKRQKKKRIFQGEKKTFLTFFCRQRHYTILTSLFLLRIFPPAFLSNATTMSAGKSSFLSVYHSQLHLNFLLIVAQGLFHLIQL